MKKNWILIFMIMLVGLSTIAVAQTDQYGNLQLKNNYISIIVNQNKLNQGRFAIDITGGAPMRAGDDGKPLLYGHPHPWTSYTTIRIDGEDYVFGGKTDKRAGKKANYGKLVQAPVIKDNSIITTYKFGKIEVSQILTFVKSSTTGLPDTAQINYRIKNNDGQAHQVGARVMIDTMLGQNDGAPFRIQNQAITGDKLFSKEEIPAFWQAFDTLSNPKVTAQGTVKGPGLTTPDELYFADWGSLADGPWSFDFNPGEEFMRKGEFELDSAMALFWQPISIAPQEVKTYTTNYGLGGITIVPGLLSLGVTSPAEVVMDQPDKKVQIVAYVQNTAEIKAKGVKVSLQLPEGLVLKSNSEVKRLGDLKSGSTAQVMWEVSPRQIVDDKLNYKVKVSAENTDSNQVTRDLKIVGPPSLSLKLKVPEKLKAVNNQLARDSFTVQGTITNHGASTAYGVSSYLALSPGLGLSAGEKDEKFLGYLTSGESITVPWSVKTIGIVDGNLIYAVEVNSLNAKQKMKKGKITIPQLEPEAKITIEDKEQDFVPGDYLTAKIKLKNLANFYRVKSKLNYNEQVLEPIYVSRGNLFVQDRELLSWNYPQINEQAGVIKGISGALDTTQDVKEGVVASIHFKVKAPGKTNLKLTDIRAYNGEEEIDFKVTNNHLIIGGKLSED